MPKDIICSFDSLYKAALKCKNNVMWKDSTAGFMSNYVTNIAKLRNGLLCGSYRLDGYTVFFVYEPKMRQIVSTRIKDRVFQRSMCDNYLYDEMTKHFIHDNCACQADKGTDTAIGRLKCHLQRFYRKNNTNGWVLKCDIKDFFGQTSHKVALDAVKKRVGDEWVTLQVETIINSFIQGADKSKGMGLGSEVTQLVQLAVLDDLDHFIKEKLHIKYYIRYMDDFILIHDDKEYLKYCKDQISEHIQNIGLRFSDKKTKIFPVTQRIRFLGFSFELTSSGKVVQRILPENINNERRKLRLLVGRAAKGFMTKQDVDACYEGWKAHAKRGNNHNEILKMDAYYKSLWEVYYNAKVQKHQRTA
jgi:retron-type reverse transcriptase